MNRSILSTALLLCAFGLALMIAGCAGKGVDFTTWVATYSGSGALDNSKTGDLTLSCDASGIVTGTLTVTGADGTDTFFKFTPGSYALAGSITSTDGNFEVSGTVPNNATFIIRGHFNTDTIHSTLYNVITGTSTTLTTSQHYTGSLIRN
jgi:hypothetical protein